LKRAWLLASLLAIVFAFGIGFVFILPRVRMLRAVLPEGNTLLSEAARASVQDPVILTLIRVRFLLALGIPYLVIAKPDLATTLFILLGRASASSTKVGAGCGNSARPYLCRGSCAITIPTPTPVTVRSTREGSSRWPLRS
jgi:hypothetical protein